MHPPSEKSEITFRSDLWITDSTCTVGCNGVTTFSSSQSTSFTNTSTPFSVKYGSGSAEGSLGKDTVQMAGFSVSNQVFGKSSSYLPQEMALSRNYSRSLRCRLRGSPRCPSIRSDGSCMAVPCRLWRSALLADPRFIRRMGPASDVLPDNSFLQYLPGQNP